MAGQMRRFDIGSIIRVTVKENGLVFNASAAIGKTMKLRKPSGSVLERPAEFQTDGTDGIVQYTTVANDLDESGPWTGQVFLDFAATARWHAEPFNFTVGENLS
jgi:hypothetical protein